MLPRALLGRGPLTAVPRRLVPTVLAGRPVADVLAVVERALDGSAHALLPVPPDDPGGRALQALDPGGPLADDEDDADDPTALVLSTSGSTGSPKGALLTASALRASAEATHERLGGPGTWLLALAPHHVAGVQVIVRSVVAGTTPEILDLAGGFDPSAFDEAATRLGQRTDGPRYTAMVPTQLLRLLDAAGRPRQSLADFDAVLVGGAATSRQLLDRACAAGVRVVTTYGMSETSGGCVYDGVPLADVQVRVDDAGLGDEGIVRLGGPVVARGYRGRPGDDRFTDADDDVRWFSTSDLGRWDAHRLVVTGRADDVIVTGGLKVSPQVVEQSLAELAEVAACIVVGVPDERWGSQVVALVLPTDPERPPDLDLLQRKVTGSLGEHAAPRRVVVVDSLPVHGIGKPDRRAALALARHGR